MLASFSEGEESTLALEHHHTSHEHEPLTFPLRMLFVDKRGEAIGVELQDAQRNVLPVVVH